MVPFKVNLCSICKRNDILTAHQLHDGRHYYLCFNCLSELFAEIISMLTKEQSERVTDTVERKCDG